MSPLGLAFAAAGGLALFIAVAGGGVLAWRRAKDPMLERRLRRAAAPLAGPAAAQAGGSQENIFRAVEKRSRLRESIEARYPFLDARRAVAKAAATGLAAAAGAWLSMWFLQVPTGWWTLPIVGLTGAAGAWYTMGWLQGRQEAEFVRRFPEIVEQIVRLAGAGVPALEALAVAAEDAPPPVAPILRGVSDGLNAGLDADTALRMASERVRLAEFTLFAAVIRLQRRSGGGISGAFTNLAATLRERRSTALKAHASTSQTRLTLLVLSAMPVVVLVMQKFTAPQSVEILFGTEQGTMLLRWGTGLIVTGILVARGIAGRGVE